MTLHLLPSTDPGSAARTAKHTPTEPGLPNQSANHSERTPMVSAIPAPGRVSYHPHELNRLISDITAQAVADRLREYAARYRAAAIELDASYPDAADWHHLIAAELEHMATRELLGEVA